MYSPCQVRKMTVDNLGPTASGTNFGEYSAQNDVCSFDYSTSVSLKTTRRKQIRPFNSYIVCPIVSLQSYAAVIIVHYITIDLRIRVKELMALYLLYGMSEHHAQV